MASPTLSLTASGSNSTLNNNKGKGRADAVDRSQRRSNGRQHPYRSTKLGKSAELTTAEQSRLDKLIGDPMAQVLTTQSVECHRCDSVIKLSAKSRYDLAHWHRHRARCLKWTDEEVERKRRENKSLAENTARAERVAEGSPTPPLTPGGSLTSTSSTVLEEPSPLPPPPPLDAQVKEYLLHTHQATELVDNMEAIFREFKNWTWGRIRAPVYMGELNPHTPMVRNGEGIDWSVDEQDPEDWMFQ